jgi:hypothetical protein
LLRQPLSIEAAAPAEAKELFEAQARADEQLRQERQARAAAATPSQAIRDLLLNGLGSVLALLGLGGSVAVVGAAILRIRFSEAHLPAG